jgi:hypothetical protein
MKEEPLHTEYYAILATVAEFDKRILTIKGWGVTLSLAALAWGFQYMHYGLFLVAALSGLAFWLIEGAFKRHQMRYYLRMREIEVLEYERAQEQNGGGRSSPRIDWSWSQASDVYGGATIGPGPELDDDRRYSYTYAWLFPHVMLPHVLSVLAGVALLVAARAGTLGADGTWQW